MPPPHRGKFAPSGSDITLPLSTANGGFFFWWSYVNEALKRHTDNAMELNVESSKKRANSLVMCNE